MNTEASTADAKRRPHVVRRLYDWTLSWAERPGGTWALFLIAVAESSFFPVPPDVLLIALCVGSTRKSFRFALICSAGSILGGIIGYGIGHWGYEHLGLPIVRAYHGEALMETIKAWYDQYGFWGNLAAAITPIPYKVFTISSGAFDFYFPSFLAASIIGRTFRFMLVAALIYRFGAKVKELIERYFDWAALAFMILLIGGFLVLKYLK